jgi:tripartite-type tricarboxylate transporter receptor subunit TctC
MNLKNLAAAALAGGGLLAAPQAGMAQTDYPTKPVVWIAPSSAGSGFDVIARIITPKLGQVLGQSVVVENVAGAGATVGAAKAADAKPDGYTILQINANHTAAESLYKNLSYDLIDSFEPVLRFNASYHVLVVRKGLEGVNSLADVISQSKAEPNKFNFASAGIGSVTFMCTEIFNAKAGIEMQHIPYEGGGPAMASIVAGETDFYGAPYATAKPFLESGEVKPLAMTSKERAKFAPDLPTASETVPGFEFMSWYGLVLPKGTPTEIRDKIRAAMVETLADPDIQKKLQELGFDPIDEGPDEFAAFLKNEVQVTADIVKAAGIEPK